MADFFLKIDGIPGESQNPRHQGEIEVESFSWSDSSPARSQLPPPERNLKRS